MAPLSMPREAEFGVRAYAAPPRHTVFTHKPLIGVAQAAKPIDPPARMKLPRSLSARLQTLAPPDASLKLFLNQIEGSEQRRSSARVEPAPLCVRHDDIDSGPYPPVEVRVLAQQFERRQRQATLLVAGCVALFCAVTAFALVPLGGFLSRSGEADSGARQSASTIWKAMPAQLQLAFGSDKEQAPKEGAGTDPARKILASP